MEVPVARAGYHGRDNESALGVPAAATSCERPMPFITFCETEIPYCKAEE